MDGLIKCDSVASLSRHCRGAEGRRGVKLPARGLSARFRAGPGSPALTGGEARPLASSEMLRSYSEPSGLPRDGPSTPKCSESTPNPRKNQQVDGLTDEGVPHAADRDRFEAAPKLLRNAPKAYESE